MNKLLLIFIILLLNAEIVLSSSLSVSPSTLDFTSQNEVPIKVLNSNDFEIFVQASSTYYLINSKPVQTFKIPAKSFATLIVSKEMCKDDYLTVKIVNSSLKQGNILPSLRVKIHCENRKTEVQTKQVDPFTGLIIVLSIVALSLFVRLML